MAYLDIEFDRSAKCPTWHDFLNKVLPNPKSRKTLQQWFGYCLTMDVSHHKFLVMYGDGANGKSVVCKVLSLLLGKDNISSVGLEGFNPARTFQLAHTVGKLANIVSELNSHDKAAEGELKKFVSGDLMTAEEKYGQPFSFTPTAKLIYATNDLPSFKDTSDGIWRRIMLLPFSVQIPPEEQRKELTQDEFWKSSGEVPGILNWALGGVYSLYIENGFTESDESISLKNEFHTESNPTKEFLLEYFEESIGYDTPTVVAYQLYDQSMRSQGHEPLSPIKFSQEVRRVFKKVNSSKNARHCKAESMRYGTPERSRLWLNLKLKQASDINTDTYDTGTPN